MSRVFVLGNASLDTTLRVPRLPAPGETLMATGIQRSTGGSILLSAAKVVETAWATSRAGPMKPATGRRAATH